MMELLHDELYWQNRWDKNETGWDIGYASTPLANYFDQLENKELRMLIPGAGNAYEAEYLHQKGFSHVFVIDIAEGAIENIKHRVPLFPESHLIHGDFFKLNDQFDLIIEQTFFCALHPSERVRYVQKMQELLKPNGKLVGLLFNDPLFEDHPPYGGFEPEYRELFSDKFTLNKLETCTNSIPPRKDRELFFKFTKR